MTISPAQSRAARALLHLSQAEVESKTNIGQSRLSYFENPTNEFLLSGKDMLALERFYTGMGLEFLDRDGLRRKAAGMIELKGYEGFKEFIYDVYETVKNGGDICVTNVDERQFERWQGENAVDYLSKMASIKGLRFRVLIQEGDNYYTASKYAVYRALPKQFFTGVPTYVFGNKKAEILFDTDTVTVFVIDNARMAEAQRSLFTMAWGQASEPV